MVNALEEFRKHYAGEDPTETMLTAKTAAEIKAAYEAAYNHAFRVLALAKRKDNYPLKASDGSILEEIQAIFMELKGQMTNALKLGIWEAVKLATKTAQNDQLLMGLARPEAKGLYGPPDKRYISTVYKDTFSHIAARTDHMTQTVKEALRRDVVDVMRRASVEGLTRKQAYNAIREQTLARDPDFAFFDRSGRRWAAQDYFDMLTKTAMANALRESYVDQLIADGHDLAKVSIHGTRCKLCSPWEGKELSLTGSTEGYPTLAQAKAAGLFHPRCRHRLIAYTPAIGAA